MFVTRNKQKLHRYDQVVGGGVFEVLGICSLLAMTTPVSNPIKNEFIKCNHPAMLGIKVTDLIRRNHNPETAFRYQ